MIPKKIQVSLEDVRKILAKISYVQIKVLHDGSMHSDDKKAIRYNITEMQTILNGWLQLGLFSKTQQAQTPDGTQAPTTKPIAE